MTSRFMMMPIKLLKPCGEPWTPHKYQKRTIKFGLERACAAFFLDPGLGKTSITLAIIKILMAKKMVKKVLIIAPVRVCYAVWPREIERWGDFSHLTIKVLHGPKKDEVLKQEADIFVINPEGLDWLLKAVKTKTPSGKKTHVDVDVKAFKKLGFDMLVVDELNKFKHISSNRFKALKQVLHTFARRIGLTGSPAANGLMDLFGQAYILDMGRSFGPYVSYYRTKYFDNVDKDGEKNGYIWKPKPGAEEQIYERLSPLAIRVGDEELEDMPERVVTKIYVELPPKVQAFYDELEADLIGAIQNKMVVVSNAAVLSGKCRQIANGGIYITPELQPNGLLQLGKKREFINLHDEKTDALLDLVDELQGSPLLVAYDFGHDLDRLRKAFPSTRERKVVFACDHTAKQFGDIERDWNNGDITVLFGHPQSIGHGLNLQQGPGHHVCWHSQTWDYDLFDQYNRRILRQGNKAKKVFIYHLLAKNTVDELVVWALNSKHKGQQALFSALLELAKTKRQRVH